MAPAAPPEKAQTGSPFEGEPDFLLVGRLGRPHGVRGEIQFRLLTGFPERLVSGKAVYIGEDHAEFRIAGLRGAAGKQILALHGLNGREQAARLRNSLVYVRTEGVPPLPEGEYYFHELIGMRVVSDNGSELGRLAEIIETGANDVFVVREEDGRERLLPAIDDVLLEIDPVQGTILVHLLPGL